MEHRAYLMRLEKQSISDYREMHKKEKIWQSVVDGLIKAGFQKMIIFQRGQDIILFEEAEDLKNAYRYLSTDEESVRWDKMVSKFMEEYPHYNEIEGDIEIKEIPVIFYFENGKMLH